MAPVRTYITIGDNSSLMVRTFLNKSQLELNKVRRPVTMKTSNRIQDIQLMKYKRIIMSNRHLKELYNDSDTKRKLMTILFEMNKEEIFSIARNVKMNDFNFENDDEKDKAFKGTDKMYLNVSNYSWKCMIYISWNEIETLRNWMEGYDVRSGRINWKKCEKLMIRELKFESSEDKEDEHFSDSDEENVKKPMDFKFCKTRTAPIPINIHVFSKV
ncbi:hypothetical protein CANINC_002173 [Pichia inconspicua]|uniref:Uncharacterized protein n=1 Tax=Pichia inconspicua TaxID=52247 RepID=A0A4T0X363_9ASCO|nr:hypothetical protein CANINC_002173 [[Candida] inconspicua]